MDGIKGQLAEDRIDDIDSIPLLVEAPPTERRVFTPIRAAMLAAAWIFSFALLELITPAADQAPEMTGIDYIIVGLQEAFFWGLLATLVGALVKWRATPAISGATASLGLGLVAFCGILGHLPLTSPILLGQAAIFGGMIALSSSVGR